MTVKLYRTSVSIWFALQALKPKLQVDQHIQSHYGIPFYNIPYWLSIKAKIQMKTISYNLRRLNGNSNEYYRKIYQFSQTVFDKTAHQLGKVIDELICYLVQNKIEKPRSDNKVLLVSACMQINNGKDCKANQKGIDITCTSGNKNCRINKLTQIGQKNKFDVFTVPHSVSFTKWLKKWENSEKLDLQQLHAS